MTTQQACCAIFIIYLVHVVIFLILMTIKFCCDLKDVVKSEKKYFEYLQGKKCVGKRCLREYAIVDARRKWGLFKIIKALDESMKSYEFLFSDVDINPVHHIPLKDDPK